jgi:AhpD family alkylhydroperoxidase
MINALQGVAWEPCLLEPARDRALEDYARRKQGMPNPALPLFAPVPWLARALVDLHAEYGLLLHLDQETADLVSLVVSQENSCRFCYAAVRAMLWSQGMSKERIQRIEQDLTRADLPPRTLAAILFGRSQSRSGPATAGSARDALLASGFSEQELREIAFVVATVDFGNRVHTIAAVPVRPIERLPEQWHVRLLRPLLKRVLGSRRTRGSATPAPQARSGYPYAQLVAAYSGSPVAPVLQNILEDMWASPHLSRRCKLLMIAVIARGLGCESCAADAGAHLTQSGLDRTAQAHILTHLDAPELEPVERQLVSFARETIWYEPAAVQRRARLLREQVSGPQLLEAIGVASLANGLCRMGAMVAARP